MKFKTEMIILETEKIYSTKILYFFYYNVSVKNFIFVSFVTHEINDFENRLTFYAQVRSLLRITSYKSI